MATKIRLGIAILTVLTCFSLAVYYTHKEHTKCDKYETLTFNVTNISSYTDYEYQRYDCSKCRNGNMFHHCDYNMENNLNGSCYVNSENKCDNDRKWTDEYGFVHKEKYTRHVRYNYFEHCYTGWIYVSHYAIQLGMNDMIDISCVNSSECDDRIVQKYQIGTDVQVVKDKSNNQYYDSVDCNSDVKTQTLILWFIVSMASLFSIYSYVAYRDKLRALRFMKEHRYGESNNIIFNRKNKKRKNEIELVEIDVEAQRNLTYDDSELENLKNRPIIKMSSISSSMDNNIGSFNTNDDDENDDENDDNDVESDSDDYESVFSGEETGSDDTVYDNVHYYHASEGPVLKLNDTIDENGNSIMESDV